MAEGSSKRKDADEEAEDLELALNPARNYPRKRVAIAVLNDHVIRLSLC